jgi:recombination protein RecA
MSTSVSIRAALSLPAEIRSSPVSPSRMQSIRSGLGNLARQIVPATSLPEPTAPPLVRTGIASLDQIVGGIPRGALSEIYGPASSGRTSLMLSLLSGMTRAGEVCALVDASDNFSPHVAAAAGVDFNQLLWVRCNGQQPRKEKQPPRYIANDFAGHDYVESKSIDPKNLAAKANPFADQQQGFFREPPRDRIARSEAFRRVEQSLKVTDLLLQGGGFGLIVIDFGNIAPEVGRRVPLTSWFRFRRTVENTPTALVVLEQEAYAKTCASLVLRAERTETYRCSINPGAPSHALLLRGMNVSLEVERAAHYDFVAGRKKRPHSVRADFRARAFVPNY